MSTVFPAGLLLLRMIFGPLAALALAELPPRWEEPCHPRQLLTPSGQSGCRRQACSGPADRPSSLTGIPDDKRLTYPAAESFPQCWYQGCRISLHHLSLDSRTASSIPATQRHPLVQALICGFDAWSFCRPGSIRCEWVFSESLQHDDIRTMRKVLLDHRVTY